MAVVPLSAVSAVPASAQLPPGIHWGQSPFAPNCLEGPCRIIFIVDKTQDPVFQLETIRWAEWMNFVRNHYALQIPAFAYLGPGQGVQPDPGCVAGNGTIAVCRNDAVVDADCSNPGPSTIRCTTFNVNLSNAHILWSRSSFRTQALEPADVWNVVCAALGRSIGMQPSGDASSCLQSNITLGTGQEKYYVDSDWTALFTLYNHPAGS
jgi:hypothetical protein